MWNISFPATLAILPLLLAVPSESQELFVDFRHAPFTHLSALCLPDDWQKSLINEKGELACDFGPGPYARPLTTIGLGVAGRELSVIKQQWEHPRIAIAQTELAAGDIRVQVQSFALVPARWPVEPAREEQGVQRRNGRNGVIGWTTPAGLHDPAFRNAAWGVNRPIQYCVPVAAGSAKKVALGLCEPYKPRPGMRILELHVEGTAPRLFDPLAAGERNQPHVLLFDGRDENRDGVLTLAVHAALTSPDPNVFLNGFWIFPADAAVSAEAVLRGELSAQAEIYHPCGLEYETAAPAPRLDAMLATFNSDTVTPEIIIQTNRELAFDAANGRLLWEGRPYLLSRPAARRATQTKGGWRLALPRGTRQVEVIVVHGRRGAAGITHVPDLHAELQRSRQFWQQQAGLPYDRIRLPDDGLQYVLDASIRNLYQMREMVDGRLQFQPGPSVYRGLWMHDVVYAIEAAAFLGDLAAARAVVENVMRFQGSDGQVRVMAPHAMHRETPLLIYLICRYSRLANDAGWLRAHWPAVTRGLEWIARTRAQTLADSGASYFGLMPPGFTDGGIAGINAEYSSVYWSLIATHTAVAAARWLGEEAGARRWQAFFDDFMASFRRAYERDKRRDPHGHWYLPVRIADTTQSEVPQRGQWAPLEAAFRGGFLACDGELLAGTLAVLDDSLKQGLTVNTGWLQNGLWPFFDALRGLAHLWCGNRARAVAALYAIANHASPLATWVEEQHPREVGRRTSGDVSNASASAFFLGLVRHLLVLERGREIELLAGVPPAWLSSNATIALPEAPTEWGTLSLQVHVSADGRRASIAVVTPRVSPPPGELVIRLEAFKEKGFTPQRGGTLPDAWRGKWGGSVMLELVRQN
ncbi:MAG: hypothetical protein ONB48_20240 [candidate division KSB1 bacterium]|nr:hypothetical protein [candidate division KSB1 bacterium]MDZ7276216.1 hypothetical protein [candidate division KSB1 bacterium]MDZ7287978.1 hypothetical protein [candidate division KSB1 bacterium]MDZ7300009.1 hypothetical protein [candidate division KSB1 bacterium]MDZ7308238.1 hypothetical protein [candidate division KSB1 bacterium]